MALEFESNSADILHERGILSDTVFFIFLFGLLIDAGIINYASFYYDG